MYVNRINNLNITSFYLIFAWLPQTQVSLLSITFWNLLKVKNIVLVFLICLIDKIPINTMANLIFNFKFLTVVSRFFLAYFRKQIIKHLKFFWTCMRINNTFVHNISTYVQSPNYWLLFLFFILVLEIPVFSLVLVD